jgi:hypothetical protein
VGGDTTQMTLREFEAQLANLLMDHNVCLEPEVRDRVVKN